MKHKGLHFWIFVTLLIPIFGTFFPPQAYFYTGDIHDQTFDAGIFMPIILVLLSLSIIWMSVAQQRRADRLYHDPFVYLFAVAAFASIFISLDVRYSFNRMLRLLPLIGFGVMYAQIIPWRKILSIMTSAFFVSALTSIVISIAVPQLGNSHYGGVYESAWRGALIHKNSTGALYAVGMIVCAHALLCGHSRKFIASLSFIMCAIMVVKSQSATGLAAATVTLLIYLFLRMLQRSSTDVRVFAVLSLALSVTAGIMLFAAFPELATDLVGRDPTFTGRTEIWQAVWWAVQQSPVIGYGYGFWGIDSPMHQKITFLTGFVTAHSHNDWLDIWLQVGFFGVVAISLDIAYVVCKSLSVTLVSDSPEGPFLFALMIFTIIRSLVEVQFTDPGTYNLFWLVWASVGARLTNLKRQC